MNYTELYQYVIQYYPLGIPSESSSYEEYESTKRLRKVVGDKFQSELYAKWENLIVDLQKNLPDFIKYEGNTGSEEPCYSGSLILYEKDKPFRITRKLDFYVSLLAPCFVIVGLDQATLFWKDQESKEHRPGVRYYNSFEPIAYISPFGIYKDYFLMVRNGIEHFFEGYKMLNFTLLGATVDSLNHPGVHHVDGRKPTIFNALVHSSEIPYYRWIGDRNYK